MTEIEFHVNVADKLHYSCRLLRKVLRSGVKAVVTAEAELLAQLDQLLWQFSTTEFLPHCMSNAPAHTVAVTPVLLSAQLDGCAADSVLINLGQRVPGILSVLSVLSKLRQICRTIWFPLEPAGSTTKTEGIRLKGMSYIPRLVQHEQFFTAALCAYLDRRGATGCYSVFATCCISRGFWQFTRCRFSA